MTAPVPLPIVKLPHAAALPTYATEGAAGMDLCAAVDDTIVIPTGYHALIPTGCAVAVPDGYEMQIRPRSGLALKHGVTVLNTPGTVDGDYRGEIRVILANLGHEPFAVRRGDRIAQAVLAPVARAHLVPVDRLEDTARGERGFGSTGV